MKKKNDLPYFAHETDTGTVHSLLDDPLSMIIQSNYPNEEGYLFL